MDRKLLLLCLKISLIYKTILRYKNKDEFVSDVRLIFDNCETFNEDESPVGQAGHNLRAFFESKWKEHNGK